MKICTKCVLPESFPGISYDQEGLCSFCQRYKGRENQHRLKKRFESKFLSILENLNNKGPYQALMAYSGGKDSTYTLKLLKEYFNLSVLAITLDHGFVSPMALQNIRKVTETLDVDNMTIHPGATTLCDVFVKSMDPGIYPIKALERASSICNSCMNLVKSFLLKTAIEMNVPIVAYGWSPGQAPVQSSVFKTNSSMIHQMQKAMIRPINELVDNKLSAFFLEKRHFDNDSSSQDNRFPYLVHPLAFLDYDEEKILGDIEEMGVN